MSEKPFQLTFIKYPYSWLAVTSLLDHLQFRDKYLRQTMCAEKDMTLTLSQEAYTATSIKHNYTSF